MIMGTLKGFPYLEQQLPFISGHAERSTSQHGSQKFLLLSIGR